MDTVESTLPLLVGAVFLVAFAVRDWLKRRRAVKLADQLLEDVVKGKDAFRR
ncbi:MAG: hypothetical protein ACKOBZ_05525 [Nitrospira sp.]